MKTIKGPALFLAQFAGDDEPFNSWDAITKWAADCGYIGVQVPSWDGRLFDLTKAAESQDYCDEIKGVAESNGVVVTEIVEIFFDHETLSRLLNFVVRRDSTFPISFFDRCSFQQR